MSFASITKAQITLTSSDVDALLGQTFNVTTYEATAPEGFDDLVSLKGENQVFDFTGITAFNDTLSGKFTYLNTSEPTGLPGATDTSFTNANTVIAVDLSDSAGTDSTSWIYEKVNSEGVYTAGFVFVNYTDSTNDTLKFAFNPYMQSLKFPLTYGTTWKDTANFIIPIPDSLKELGASMSISRIEDAIVDGYGTLELPGKSSDCLRLMMKDTTISNISYSFGGMSFALKDTNVSTTILYVTKSLKAQAASIILGPDGTVTSASYTILSSGTPIEAPRGSTIAKSYQLNQNYPNPFNPSTVISYNLKQAGPVKLQVYNALGQLVATLVNNAQAAGDHQVRFNATGLTSGLYFYKLQAGNFTKTKKMMLIK